MVVDQPDPDALLRLTLRPHRSLGRAGFIVVMALLAFWSFVAGIVFWAVGAWPVVGFIGIDVLLVYLAFRFSFSQARQAEHLHLTRDALTITRVDRRGRARSWSFQAYWLRLVLEELPGGSNRLSVSSHGRSLSIGGFLAPEERAGLCDRLSEALARVQAMPSTSRML